MEEEQLMELIEMNELQQVLQDLANDIAENYKEHLEYHDRFTTERSLLNSVKAEVVAGDAAYEVTLTLNDYWKYVEEGVRGAGNPSSPHKNPGWKAFPHIMRWIDIKPVIPRPDKEGRVPSPKQLAYLITRSIVEKGTQGSHDLQTTKDNVLTWYKEKIAAALGHDMENYIRKVVKE